MCLGVFNYISKIDQFEEQEEREIEAEGFDLKNLLFNFVDECYSLYAEEYFICHSLTIVEFDEQEFYIRAIGRGEFYDPARHKPGTEVKVSSLSFSSLNRFLLT